MGYKAPPEERQIKSLMKTKHPTAIFVVGCFWEEADILPNACWLGDVESNHGSRIQNPLFCH